MFDIVPIENTSIEIIDGDRGKNYPKTDFYDKGVLFIFECKKM